jgi:hypothetical protein
MSSPPANSARSPSADHAWPGAGRAPTARSSSGLGFARNPSIDNAAAICAPSRHARASSSASTAAPTETAELEQIASPSRGPGASGVSPVRASASPASHHSPSCSACPSPISVRPTCAIRHRSAAPTDPLRGMRGCTPRLSRPASDPASAGDAPEPPLHRPPRRTAIAARVSSRDSGSPTAVARARIVRCEYSTPAPWSTRSVAREPSPVVTPYTGAPVMAISSTSSLEACIRFRAASATTTGASARAIAQTAATSRSPPVNWTAWPERGIGSDIAATILIP